MRVLNAGQVVTSQGVVSSTPVVVEDGIISGIGEGVLPGAEIIDLRHYTLLPGLIDIHIHGCNGFDVMDATPRALKEIANYLAQNGVTSFLGATVTARMSKIHAAVANIAGWGEWDGKGAKLLGLYIEGPYISPDYRGAHPESYIRPANWEEIAQLLKIGQGAVKVVALAPESGAEVVRKLVENKVVVALGHSAANYQQTMAAIAAGAGLGVHIFNGMKGIHHREPGIVGALLSNDQVRVELIADGIHVAWPIVEIVRRCKGKEGLVLVSDSMRAGGLKDGIYDLGELKVCVQDGVARLVDEGSLAGSTLRLMDGVKNMVANLGVPLVEAVAMATIVPAKVIGRDMEMGSIEVGKKADLVAIDREYKVVFTMINGKVVHDIRKESEAK